MTRCTPPDVATDRTPARRSGVRLVEVALTVVALAVVVAFFGWTAATEGAFERAGDQDYHASVVRGWRAGHVHLAIEPAPELVRLADPYDPAQNAPYRLPDASYYRGHYYLYFGAAPAFAVMLPYAVLTGDELSTATATFVFCAIALTAATIVWLAVRRRYFPAAASWGAPLGVLVLGGATHLLALARRPMWWELPIAAELAFCALALSALYVVVHTASPRRRVVAFAAAGLCLGLAIASRPTAVFALAMLIPVAVHGWRRRHDGGWRLGAVAAVAALAACAAAVGAYNFARFGEVLEFGQKYQLSGMYEGKVRHFAAAYVAPNLFTYFLQPLRWHWEFPFAQLWTRSVDVPGYFDGEELSGLLASFPVLIGVGGLPWLLWRRVGNERDTLRTFGGAVLLYVTGMMLVLLSFFSATERYQAEFGFGVGWAALLGWLALEHRVAGTVGRYVEGVVRAGLVAVSVAIGILVSLDYHGALMKRDAPETWERLERLSEATLGRIGLALDEFSGPRVLKVRFREQPPGTVEPLWQSSDPRAGERVLVEHVTAHEIRLGYARGSQSAAWGRPLRWEPGHTHTVEIQLPSLYGSPQGWMRGLRFPLEFHERSSVALWFSGGRAFSAVVSPLLPEIQPGGHVAPAFSGEVRAMSRRLYRRDEVEASRPAVAGEAPGGVLRLRVRLAEPLADEGEPLVSMGARYGSDIVFLRPGPGGVVVACEHFGEPAIVSAPVALNPAEEHVIEIRLPSWSVAAFGAARRGVTTVAVDGREVLRREGGCHAFDPATLSVGANPFGTTCLSVFRGWILDSRWINP